MSGEWVDEDENEAAKVLREIGGKIVGATRLEELEAAFQSLSLLLDTDSPLEVVLQVEDMLDSLECGKKARIELLDHNTKLRVRLRILEEKLQETEEKLAEFQKENSK